MFWEREGGDEIIGAMCERSLWYGEKNNKNEFFVGVLTEIVSQGEEEESSVLSLLAGLGECSSAELLNVFISRTISSNEGFGTRRKWRCRWVGGVDDRIGRVVIWIMKNDDLM